MKQGKRTLERYQRADFRKASGVSLIEVLVATLVMGVGLLAVAMLQVSSTSSNQQALYYTQATSIANELADRMRASKMTTMAPRPGENMTSYSSFIDKYVTQRYKGRGNFIGGAVDCSASTSGETKREKIDLHELCQVVKNNLPDGKIRVAENPRSVFATELGNADTAVKNRLTIIIDWASSIARKDIGQKQDDDGEDVLVNTHCNAWINGYGEKGSRGCVIMSVVL